MGIGDTLRVSLTTDPEEEVFVGYEILQSLELRQKGPIMIACPTCGRVQVDLFKLANDFDKVLENIDEPIRVAVMGCIVNGPGEAKDADVGIAAGTGMAIIFRKGKIVKNVLEADMLEELIKEIDAVIEDRRNGIFDEPEDDAASAYRPMIPLVQV